MKMGIFDTFLMVVVILIAGMFVYSGFSNAARAKESYAQAMDALKTDKERPERFYGIQETGFPDFMRMIDIKAKRMFSGEGPVRGITNANGLVFVAFVDGHFAIVRPIETVQKWVEEESGKSWIIF